MSEATSDAGAPSANVFPPPTAMILDATPSSASNVVKPSISLLKILELKKPEASCTSTILHSLVYWTEILTKVLSLPSVLNTSAIALEWALAELINNPRVLQKAQEEIDNVVGKHRLVSESDGPNLPYIQAIIKETLRLHPPLPMIIRKSVQDCMVYGYNIPANSVLFVNIWSIARNPEYWESPLDFKPERFLRPENGGPVGLIDVKGQHFQLLPFGTGRRGCPGSSLAMQELPAVLGGMIQCFEWKAVNQSGVKMNGDGVVDMTEQPGMTAPRAHDLVQGSDDFPLSTQEELRKQFLELRQGITPLAQFEAWFTKLSRFAPELVETEELYCAEFEIGFNLIYPGRGDANTKIDWVTSVALVLGVRILEVFRGLRMTTLDSLVRKVIVVLAEGWLFWVVSFGYTLFCDWRANGLEASWESMMVVSCSDRSSVIVGCMWIGVGSEPIMDLIGLQCVFNLVYILRSFVQSVIQVSFPKLKTLVLDNCVNSREIHPWNLQASKISLKFLDVANLDKLIVRNCSEVAEVFQLEGLNVGEGQHVRPLIEVRMMELDGLPQLTCLWNKDPHGILGLQSLQYLTIKKCSLLRNLFTCSTAMALQQLKVLYLKSCPVMEEVIAATEDGLKEVIDVIEFPKLEWLILKDLPNLNSFCNANYNFNLPSLNRVVLKRCPDMHNFTLGQVRMSQIFVSTRGNEGLWTEDLNKYLEERLLKGEECATVDESDFDIEEEEFSNLYWLDE
ncbi:hypothetical protein TEA_015360 [Camellia sinensis var. sinensis]|uniref:Disease resistance protein At4g27190-like leucine-rich repeats domain-containing protein n=2 Tax=Camellia sinensis TaxID=4442 RepID=A0A4S4D2J8_CAMSN|nr:hypothetical protein TEA_015360 [Camellia sinensis var. sinensis]